MDERSHKVVSQPRPYSAPRVQDAGSVRDLTKNNVTGSPSDVGNGSKRV
jgi:hypothetical protein